MTRPARLAFAVALATSLLAAVAPANAAVYSVSKSTDSADGACDADCSLREAVLAANANPGSDVILVPSIEITLGRPGTDETAAFGDLDLTDDLIILGEGARTSAIDGGAIDRIFDVQPGANVELRDLSLRNGLVAGSGGAIRNRGELTVIRSELANNGAQVGGGAGTGFGGALHSGGLGSTLLLTDSAIHGNSAQAGGGGIDIDGAAELVNVTVSTNQSSAPGGGIYVHADSGPTLNNLTVTANTGTSGGGLFAESSAFTGPSPRVSNSLIAGNLAAQKPDCDAALESNHNLIGNGTGCVGPSAVNGDQVGSAASPLDPRLSGLQDATGATSTHPLQPASPAVDGGSPAAAGAEGACAPSDQRGAQRPAGSGGPAGTRCDIGAFEQTTACVAGGNVLCLAGGRFAVGADFRSGANPASARAHAVPLTDDTGYFWFFSADNVEVTLKVLDGCGLNDHFWVFAAGMTNVEVQLTVLDTEQGEAVSYLNPLDHDFETILDTSALDSCP